jgi:hypothetical protein
VQGELHGTVLLGLSQGVKWKGHEAEQPSASSAESKNGGAIFLHRPSGNSA